jgi:branched-subunit amino acid transport protein
MSQKSKLKVTQRWMILFTSLFIAAIIIGRILYGEVGFYWALSVSQLLMFLIHGVVLWKTRNPVYLIPVLMYLFMGLTFLPPWKEHPGHLVFSVAAAAMLVGFIAILITKKINWRYREILELAARPVNEASDGFTHRPFPSGRLDVTRKDVLGLARFLLKNVVAYPLIEADRVVFVIPRYMWSYLILFKRRYDKETYVAFADSGEVSVRIARPDYQAYKEELTFDRLCASLGDLFKQFMQHYRDGQPDKVIERLNTL